MRDEPRAGLGGAVALTRIGAHELALRAEHVLSVLAPDEASEPGEEVDLAARLGVAPEHEARAMLLCTPAGPLRVRIGSDVRVVAATAPAVAVPALIAPLLARLGIAALLPRGDGYALVLDPATLAELAS